MPTSFVFPASLELTHRGLCSQRIDAWGAGALIQDLLCGPEALLAHALELPERDSQVHVGARVELSLDYDAQRLTLVRDGVCELNDISLLRRSYRRALARAWPGWTLNDAQLDGAPPRSSIRMSFARELPDEAAAPRSLLTHVDRAGCVRDVDLGVDVEVALATGPALVEQLRAYPQASLGPELRVEQGELRSRCSSGALLDESRGRIELWWDTPTRQRRALRGPLARLWPGYEVTVHDEGLPRQIAASGRSTQLVALSEAEHEALLEHRLFGSRGYDPLRLSTHLYGCLQRLLAEGVAFELPLHLRPRSRPKGARAFTAQHSMDPSGGPVPFHAPKLVGLERALAGLGWALARELEPPPHHLRWLAASPAWNVLVLETLERSVEPALHERALGFLIARWRLELDTDPASSPNSARVREALVERVRRYPRCLEVLVR